MKEHVIDRGVAHVCADVLGFAPRALETLNSRLTAVGGLRVEPLGPVHRLEDGGQRPSRVGISFGSRGHGKNRLMASGTGSTDLDGDDAMWRHVRSLN
jgi:hypothetical protein